MTPRRQILLISVLAVAAFFGLRALPDTQCAFLHADHQPIIVGEVEFCGVNEEANFYSPKALQFPVELKVTLSPDGDKGELRLIKEDRQPLPGQRDRDLPYPEAPPASPSGRWKKRLRPPSSRAR